MSELDSYIVAAAVSLLFVITSAELALKKLISLVIMYNKLKAALTGGLETEDDKPASLKKSKSRTSSRRE
jgi:hypothetical protein